MRLYRVLIQNNLTEALAVIDVRCTHPRDAMETALVQCFRKRGWRHCTALNVDEMEESV